MIYLFMLFDQSDQKDLKLTGRSFIFGNKMGTFKFFGYIGRELSKLNLCTIRVANFSWRLLRYLALRTEQLVEYL